MIQATSCSSGQDISHILVNAKVHYVLTGTGPEPDESSAHCTLDTNPHALA